MCMLLCIEAFCIKAFTIRYCVFNVQYKTDLVVNQYFIRKKNAEKNFKLKS